MLFVDNRGDSRPEEDDAVDVGDMDALVEHIDAIEELEVIGIIGFEGLESFERGRIFGIGAIDMRVWVNLCEPLPCFVNHFIHVLGIGAEDEVFAVVIRHMPGEDLRKAGGIFESTAELFKYS